MSGSDGALSDADIARNLVAQAEQMKAQIATLEAESNRLMTEASELDSSVAPKKRGRPAKSKAVVM
jgi:cell division protein FtsB